MLARANYFTAAGVNCNKPHLSFPFQLMLNISIYRDTLNGFKKKHFGPCCSFFLLQFKNKTKYELDQFDNDYVMNSKIFYKCFYAQLS